MKWKRKCLCCCSLEDALIDRDQVHRQTAASVVKHIAMRVVGLGCEDAMISTVKVIYLTVGSTPVTALLHRLNGV